MNGIKNQLLRSWSVRLKHSNEGFIVLPGKRYFDPCTQSEWENYMPPFLKPVCYPLEYSINELGQIDSYNFHITCIEQAKTLIHTCSSSEQVKIINTIQEISGNNWHIYTYGIRVSNNSFSGETFYIYPTKQVDGSYSMDGIPDIKYILNWFDLLNKNVFHLDLEDSVICQRLLDTATKLRGIGVSFYQNSQIEYTIYIRSNYITLREILQDEVSEQPNYHIAMMGLKLSNHRLHGINLYYVP